MAIPFTSGVIVLLAATASRLEISCDFSQGSSFLATLGWMPESLWDSSSVLREKDRVRGAFQRTCFYVLDNPRRKELVEHPRDWPHLGAVVPGYPFLHPLAEDFWELFWKLYEREREPIPS